MLNDKPKVEHKDTEKKTRCSLSMHVRFLQKLKRYWLAINLTQTKIGFRKFTHSSHQSLNRLSQSKIWAGVAVPLISLTVGAFITWKISHIYYKKAADDLRWEARAGNIPFDEQELLVAYFNWQRELKPGQAIKLEGREVIGEVWYSGEQMGFDLTRRGLGSVYSKNLGNSVKLTWLSRPFQDIFCTYGIEGYVSKISDSNDIGYWTQGLKIDPNNIFICLNDEIKGLARYLANSRTFSLKITELWKTTGNLAWPHQVESKNLVMRIWPPSSGTD